MRAVSTIYHYKVVETEKNSVISTGNEFIGKILNNPFQKTF